MVGIPPYALVHNIDTITVRITIRYIAEECGIPGRIPHHRRNAI
jgi:hypothetical protein